MYISVTELMFPVSFQLKQLLHQYIKLWQIIEIVIVTKWQKKKDTEK